MTQERVKMQEIGLVERFLERIFSSAFGPTCFQVINFHVRRHKGRSLTELLFENPKEACNIVLAIIGGGKTQARLLRNVFENHLEKTLGHPINGELYEALIKNNAEKVREKLVKIAREYMEIQLRRL